MSAPVHFLAAVPYVIPERGLVTFPRIAGGRLIRCATGGAARDFKNETWKIGIALPSGGPQRLSADGIVDDVRIYSRALQAGDLKTIAGIAGGTPPAIAITSPLPCPRRCSTLTTAGEARATSASRSFESCWSRFTRTPPCTSRGGATRPARRR